jgi:hypothetical protein
MVLISIEFTDIYYHRQKLGPMIFHFKKCENPFQGL